MALDLHGGSAIDRAMTNLPRRNSLVSQTVVFLREQIERGAWKGWLPSERTLAKNLQVSRNTLRTALEQLKRDGIVDPRHGTGNRINSRKKTGRRSQDVAFLTPSPLEQLRPSQTLWIDEMRAMLTERNFRLHLFHGQQYFRGDSDSVLQRLVRQNPHACWILMLSNEKVQRWFEQKRISCVVAGSLYPGIDLPCRDIDHRALCRHAAGVMMAAGHRKVALLIQKSRRAGDIESELGFVEGVRVSSRVQAEVVIGNYEPSVAGICNALHRLMMQSPRPTALLVANPNHYLTVVSRLNQIGLQVPCDVSLVSRDDEPFLSYLVPTPARYVLNPYTLAKSLLRPIVEQLEGGFVTHRMIRIAPDFLPGESLAAPTAKETARILPLAP